jgi:hypothetical protein
MLELLVRPKMSLNLALMVLDTFRAVIRNDPLPGAGVMLLEMAEEIAVLLLLLLRSDLWKIMELSVRLAPYLEKDIG